MVALGSVPGQSRKVLILACYLPPGCLDYIEDLVIKLKRKYSDPYIVVAGDFNQWKIQEVMANFPDLLEARVGPTRGDRHLDRLFSNMDISCAGTVPPLETEGEARQSDHRIAFVEATLERKKAYEWVTYSYRHYDDDS